MGNFWMIGECENSLIEFKETFFRNTIIINQWKINTTTTKDSLGVKEKKKTKFGCMWHLSFSKTQPCFYFLKLQLPLPNSELHKLKKKLIGRPSHMPSSHETNIPSFPWMNFLKNNLILILNLPQLQLKWNLVPDLTQPNSLPGLLCSASA